MVIFDSFLYVYQRVLWILQGSLRNTAYQCQDSPARKRTDEDQYPFHRLNAIPLKQFLYSDGQLLRTSSGKKKLKIVTAGMF